jgi:hypothetical protein
VKNDDLVSTFGANDMALDNWGKVDRWIPAEKVTTYGPSGIGFVNFGVTREIKLAAPIETFGQGARGFNVYAGTVEKAEFGDGAVGIQIVNRSERLLFRTEWRHSGARVHLS